MFDGKDYSIFRFKGLENDKVLFINIMKRQGKVISSIGWITEYNKDIILVTLKDAEKYEISNIVDLEYIDKDNFKISNITHKRINTELVDNFLGL